jgi:hypothetical protein
VVTVARARGSSRSDKAWLENVRRAKLLEDMFYDLSEGRVRYDKVEHGLALTKWVIQSVLPNGKMPL